MKNGNIESLINIKLYIFCKKTLRKNDNYEKLFH